MKKFFKFNIITSIIVVSIFLAWGALFIYNNSFIAIDSNRYFVLFDDAMISMRYAWNLAHGNGLVWNQGQYVEGYTNLLMTLMMAFVIFVVKSRIFSVLAIQLIGLFLIIGIAIFNRLSATLLFKENPLSNVLAFLAFITAFSYFPLIFWSVTGMETGLLTFLLSGSIYFALHWSHKQSSYSIYLMAFFIGLAFLTRNDAILYATLLFAYATQSLFSKKVLKKQLHHLVLAAGIFAIFVLGQELFRYLYYGSLVPNTYTLKLSGLSTEIRLQNGLAFVWHFVKSAYPLLILVIIATLRKITWRSVFLGSFLPLSIFYQFWVGGDPWPIWRMMAPTIPISILLVLELFDNLQKTFLSKYRSRVWFSNLFLFAAFAILITSINWDNRKDIITASSNYAPFALAHVNDALTINRVTYPNATVGVFWAGTLPYFTDREAIDFLGKSDPKIATLPPVIWPTKDELGMNSVPGHNKYDLYYSIVTLKPTYIQDAYWGNQDLRNWSKENYVQAIYRYIGVDVISIKLLKDSPDVIWNEIFRIIPLQ